MGGHLRATIMTISIQYVMSETMLLFDFDVQAFTLS
jgi:hypothetical protein